MPALILKLKTNLDDDRPVFLVGSFNQWQPAMDKFQLHKTEEGDYEYTFNTMPKLPFEYKYTRGGWDSVELDADGHHLPNRKIISPASLVIDEVPNWSLFEEDFEDRFLPKIEVISEQFEIPQLIKTRRIAALLPHDYYSSDKHYPVLYLQDGQNLFDEFAPYGNWALDKRIAMLSEKGMGDIIIIAIDHGERERLKEYTPTHSTKLGVGLGKQYVQFLSETLKPYIDKKFRTLQEREYTGIGGSSMGGLISMYAALKYPEVYSKLMIFSPSLWVDTNIAVRADEYFAQFSSKIYIYGGEKESPTMIPHIKQFKSALEKNRIDESNIIFKLSVDPEGQHNEQRWGIEFPRAIEWLFFQKTN